MAGLCLAIFLVSSGVIGSEFLPHLDEGAIWVRGTLASSVGPSESIRIANQARTLLCSFPEVPECTSQVGRPDDGTDATGFFNTEYFVGLKPKEEWRPVFHQDKDRLIAAMNRELQKIPGVTWGFSQPIEDNMEEAVSGVKGELATKIYGDDLKVLEEKADQIVNTMQQVRGIEDLGVFRVLGQPNINFEVNREQAARYQINVADVQDAIQTAVGGSALTQVLQGEQRYDLVLRYLPQYRTTKEALEDIRLLSPSGERVSLAELCTIKEQDGGSEIYREENQRYVAIKYSVRGRDLGGAVEEAMRKVNAKVQLPRGYHIDWEGEYESQKRAQARLLVIVPLTILVIFMIIYSMFRSPKWAALILATVAMASAGGLAGSAHHGNPLQRFLRRRIPGAVRRLRPDGRHHARIHQSASRPGRLDRGIRDRWSRPEAAPHHDDHAGGDAGPVAGRAFARHRIRFPAALRDRYRGRLDGQPGHEHFYLAHALRLARERWRQAPGTRAELRSVAFVGRASACLRLDPAWRKSKPDRLKPSYSNAILGYTVCQRGSGGIGRRASLRSWWPKGRRGSSPFFRTIPIFLCVPFEHLFSHAHRRAS